MRVLDRAHAKVATARCVRRLAAKLRHSGMTYAETALPSNLIVATVETVSSATEEAQAHAAFVIRVSFCVLMALSFNTLSLAATATL